MLQNLSGAAPIAVGLLATTALMHGMMDKVCAEAFGGS
jgi:hypothetical protein